MNQEFGVKGMCGGTQSLHNWQFLDDGVPPGHADDPQSQSDSHHDW